MQQFSCARAAAPGTLVWDLRRFCSQSRSTQIAASPVRPLMASPLDRTIVQLRGATEGNGTGAEAAEQPDPRRISLATTAERSGSWHESQESEEGERCSAVDNVRDKSFAVTDPMLLIQNYINLQLPSALTRGAAVCEGCPASAQGCACRGGIPSPYEIVMLLGDRQLPLLSLFQV